MPPFFESVIFKLLKEADFNVENAQVGGVVAVFHSVFPSFLWLLCTPSRYCLRS